MPKDANINTKDELGKLPLRLGKTAEHGRIVEKKGADINTKDELGKLPLHLGNTALHQATGVNVNIKDNEGKTPLDIAREKRYTVDDPQVVQQAGASKSK